MHSTPRAVGLASTDDSARRPPSAPQVELESGGIELFRVPGSPPALTTTPTIRPDLPNVPDRVRAALSAFASGVRPRAIPGGRTRRRPLESAEFVERTEPWVWAPFAGRRPASALLIGGTGEGKSVAFALWTLRLLLQGVQVVIVNSRGVPDWECAPGGVNAFTWVEELARARGHSVTTLWGQVDAPPRWAGTGDLTICHSARFEWRPEFQTTLTEYQLTVLEHIEQVRRGQADAWDRAPLLVILDNADLDFTRAGDSLARFQAQWPGLNAYLWLALHQAGRLLNSPQPSLRALWANASLLAVFGSQATSEVAALDKVGFFNTGATLAGAGLQAGNAGAGAGAGAKPDPGRGLGNPVAAELSASAAEVRPWTQYQGRGQGFSHAQLLSMARTLGGDLLARVGDGPVLRGTLTMYPQEYQYFQRYSLAVGVEAGGKQPNAA